MASVLWKRGKLWVRLKGNKTPDKWSAHPCPADVTTEEAAQRYADAAQAAIDKRNATKEADRLAADRARRRAKNNTRGIIYALQLLPDLVPNRLKIGFTSSPIERRLHQHRVTCPALVLLARWPASRRDEPKAHALVAGRLGSCEIFDVLDVDAALRAIDSLLGERL